APAIRCSSREIPRTAPFSRAPLFCPQCSAVVSGRLGVSRFAARGFRASCSSWRATGFTLPVKDFGVVLVEQLGPPLAAVVREG
ncbi:hypothetical protein, partial [Saccharopolyspora rectivirgula]|uniref:hypothetical protein n=1 Tax=Saccharopolyspora rectivirgula TaxID=28042 RepID=UPI001F45B747